MMLSNNGKIPYNQFRTEIIDVQGNRKPPKDCGWLGRCLESLWWTVKTVKCIMIPFTMVVEQKEVSYFIGRYHRIYHNCDRGREKSRDFETGSVRITESNESLSNPLFFMEEQDKGFQETQNCLNLVSNSYLQRIVAYGELWVNFWIFIKHYLSTKILS